VAKMNWLPIAAGVGVGVGALLLWQNYAKAAPALGAANSQINLQPGQQTANIPRSTTVTLALPAGAAWTTAGTPIQGLPIAITQPSGNQTFNITASANPGNMAPVTASWVDSTGTAQTTTVNITLT
jgi:hypothetical protein